MSSDCAVPIFDFASVTNTSTIAILGRRKSGKTTLIKDITRRLDFHSKTIFGYEREYSSGTTTQESNVVEILEEYSESVVDAVLHAQKIKRLGDPEISECHLIVADDRLHTGWSSNVLTSLFCNNRSLRIGVIFTLHYPLGIRPRLRDNVDFVFIFKETNPDALRSLYKYWCVMFSTFEEFVDVFESITEAPYWCMVISNTVTSNTATRVFRYKVTTAEHGDVKN